MKESDLNKSAMDHVRTVCPRAKIYKHNDRRTEGMPDTSVTWNDRTSWLEFKHLSPTESIHAQLKKHQLLELVDLEQRCHRAWVIAFRKANPKKLQLPMTIFYRPILLLNGAVPDVYPAPALNDLVTTLQTYAVVYPGHHYGAISQLILLTHQ